MAEVEDTLAPSSVSGSGVYGVDSAWVEGNKAPESAIHYANEEILRVSIKSFIFDRRRRNFKGKVVILRVDQRKVALRLLHILSGWNEKHLLLIDLDRVLVAPCRYAARNAYFQCFLQQQHDSKPYLFDFETMQDLFEFQEFFTRFSAQILIQHVAVRLQPKGRESPEVVISDIQLWKKIPSRFESLMHTHDGLRNPSQLPETGAKAKFLGRGEIDTQPDTIISSDMGLRSTNSSVNKRHASLLLVFSGYNVKRYSPSPLIRVPIDETISIAKRGEPLDVELVVGGAKTSHHQNPPLSDTFANRTSATASGAAGLIALGLTATESNVQASRLSEIDNSDSQELDWIKLGFDETVDRAAFMAALNALIDPHESRYEPETHGSNGQSLGERGSLTRKYESAVIDADDVMPPAKQTDANPELTSLHKAKAGQVNSSAPLSKPRRGLAGDSTIYPYGRADIVPLVAGSLDPKFGSRRGLAGNPTIHPYGRADIVPLVADLLGPSLKFHGRNRSVRSISLPCPFHVFGCKEEFHHDRKQQWVEHSLSHFQRRERGGRGLVRVEPPDSCLCHFCKTNFSSSSGTACWKDYMNHVCDCGLDGRVPLDSKFIEYLWLNRLISYRNYRTIRPLRRSPSETNMAQDFALIESRSSASSIWETSRSDKQVSTSETQIDRKIRGASVGTSAKQEQWRRRICRKIIVFMLWKREQDLCLPTEFWSSPASFKFSDVLRISPLDKIKGLFETYSGREWDWWPFDPPAKPLASGKVRIRWQCTCGDQRWTDASRYLARKCQASVNENTTAGHESGNATSQSAGSAASHSYLGSAVPGLFPSDSSQPTGVTSNIYSTAQASHIQDTNKSCHSKDLYVLLCIYQGSQILHCQILASKCQNDEAFFDNLRQDYRRLRGFFRFWFSPLQFSHCDFVKFTRFYVNELAKVGHSLPIDLIYQYNPRPPGPHEDPPISPHEFRRRFYTHFVNPCGRDEALERIPKRQKRFQVNLHVNGREDMWGLHVELRPCFLVVLMWQIVITAGGWAFMGWWLSRHQGDLQNAAVPVTLIVMAVMALWAPIRKGMTEAL